MMASHVPLAMYTTLKAGGSARFFARVTTREDAVRAYALAGERGMPVTLLGGGSNMLFADGEYSGMVVKNEIGDVHTDGEYVVAGGGAATATVVLASVKAHLTGIEAWAGLPGTIGGAARGNAGCYGVEVKDVLESVTLLDPVTGRVHTEDAAYMEFGYRESRLKRIPEVVLEVRLRLKPEGDVAAMDKAREIAQLRNSKQPSLPTAGSFFKNPGMVSEEVRARLPVELQKVPTLHSWQVVDSLGLRGYSVGDAQVSEKHANYLVNRGQATTTEILAVARKIEEEALKHYGLVMVREVEVVGG